MNIHETNGLYNIQNASEIDLFQLTERLLFQKLKTTDLSSPTRAVDYFRAKLAHQGIELFMALWLNSQNFLITETLISAGTIDSSAVYPREVLKEALKHNAKAVIFAHNHPSGATKPGTDDINITKRLEAALALIDIKTHDHIIIGNTGHCSLREENLF